ncbi:MAG: hypothetical protein U1F77_02020 [Kiritimatiellia bacterium]
MIPEPGRGMLHVRVDDVPDTIAPEVSFYREDGRVSDTTARKRGVSLHVQREQTKPGPVYFHVQDGYFSDGGVSSGAQDDYSAQPYSVRVDFIPAKDAGEPNDGHDTARVLQPGETAEGTIFPRGDQDYFRLALPAGKQGVGDPAGRHAGQPLPASARGRRVAPPSRRPGEDRRSRPVRRLDPERRLRRRLFPDCPGRRAGRPRPRVVGRLRLAATPTG